MVDLIINGTTTTLYGIQNYGNVEIKNGGILYVTPYNGTPDTGTLEIHANNILVDATSQIIADTRGFRGMQSTAGPGEGPGAGTGGGFSGSGAGYGGLGGGSYQVPGPTYGTESGTDIERGSGGGCGVYFSSFGKGGNGGGLVALYANTMTINGIISSNGENGTTGAGQHGSGGGSGGGILINSTNVTISGTVRANGGNGSNASGSPRLGGDGGAGGRIKIFYGTLNTTGSTITANGSPGGSGNAERNGQAGANGTIYSASTIEIGHLEIHSDPDNAEIYIDDYLLSDLTPAIIDMPIGMYNLRVHKNGYADYTEIIIITTDFTLYRSVTLPYIVTGTGPIDIKSTPPGAKIYIDNVLQLDINNQPLLTPVMITGIPVGDRYVELTFAGYQNWTATVPVVENTILVIDAALVQATITATLINLSTNTCTGSCQVTADVTWQNLGSTNMTFTPAILIDGTTIVYATSDITIGPYPATGSSTITTPTLSIGTYQICPYPN